MNRRMNRRLPFSFIPCRWNRDRMSIFCYARSTDNAAARLSVIECLIFSTFLLAAITFRQTTAEAGNQPNFILCMGDDHGWEETGYNGHPFLKTPVLDEMASSGLKLNRFYSGHPSCSPTRGSVMTGRHPNRYGTFAPNWSIRPQEISIAHLLSQAGYRCAHFGKWHLGPVKKSSPTSPGAMGFDQWLSHDNFFELNPSFSRNGGPPQIYEGESSEILVQQALKFIEDSHTDQKPFFLVIWFGSPHEPYSGLPQDLAIYDDLPTRFNDRKVRLTSNETGKSVHRPLGDVLRERYAEITAMDRAMGELRKGLDQHSVRENTLLWYCGDNGTPASGLLKSPLKGQKAQMYEGGIRVPGVIEWPAVIPSPRSSDHVSVTSDMLPTLCAAAGISPSNRLVDGIDLNPLLQGKNEARKEPVCFWSFNTRGLPSNATPWLTTEQQEGTTPLVKLMNGKPTRTFRNDKYEQVREVDYLGARAITTQRFKLIVDQSSKESVELYDLEKDLGETKNIAEQRPEIVSELATQLRSWQESVLNSLTGADYN
jgi:arylsulfatase A-like enzyme